MVMRRILIISLFIISIILICGCESGNLIAYYEISGTPKKIIYIANIDTALDLSGLKTIIHYRDGSSIEEPMGIVKDPVGSDGHKIHEIDFNKPGVYEVDLSFVWRYIGSTTFQSKDMTLSYKIFVQVIDDATYNTLKEDTNE